MTTITQEWFSIKETSTILGLSERMIRNLIATGQLTARRASPKGGRWTYRIHRRNIDNFGKPATNTPRLTERAGA